MENEYITVQEAGLSLSDLVRPKVFGKTCLEECGNPGVKVTNAFYEAKRDIWIGEGSNFSALQRKISKPRDFIKCYLEGKLYVRNPDYDRPEELQKGQAGCWPIG